MSSETSGLYFSGIQLLSAMRMLIVGYCFRLDGEAAFRQSRGPRIDRPNPSTRSRTTAHPRLRSPSERPSSGVGQANPAGPPKRVPPPARESRWRAKRGSFFDANLQGSRRHIPPHFRLLRVSQSDGRADVQRGRPLQPDSGHCRN